MQALPACWALRQRRWGAAGAGPSRLAGPAGRAGPAGPAGACRLAWPPRCLAEQGLAGLGRPRGAQTCLGPLVPCACPCCAQQPQAGPCTMSEQTDRQQTGSSQQQQGSARPARAPRACPCCAQQAGAAALPAGRWLAGLRTSEASTPRCPAAGSTRRAQCWSRRTLAQRAGVRTQPRPCRGPCPSQLSMSTSRVLGSGFKGRCRADLPSLPLPP